MKVQQAAATRNSLHNALIQRFSFEHPQHGMVPSKAIFNRHQAIECMLLKEEFVNLVVASDEFAWDMPKTLTRYLPQRLTSVGQRFFELIQHGALLPPLVWHETGLCQQLFDRIAGELELNTGNLSRNPMFQQNQQAPREGEYLNGFVERIRKLGCEQTFQDALRERQKASMLPQREAKKLLTSLSGKTRALVGDWITLEYQYSEKVPLTPNKFESNAHLNIFRDGLQDMAIQIRSVGQIWMRDYLPETGFRIRMLLLHDPLMLAPLTDWADPLMILWKKATNESGKFLLNPVHMGLHEIEQELKLHALSELVIRSLSGSADDFGCFNSFDMSRSGLPAQSRPVSG